MVEAGFRRSFIQGFVITSLHGSLFVSDDSLPCIKIQEQNLTMI